MAIVQTGTTLTFNGVGPANVTTVSSTITVPADAELVIVGVSAYVNSNIMSTGTVTFTKGGTDTAMTYAGGDSLGARWSGPCWYLNAPDTGTNKSLKWDWAGTAGLDDAQVTASVTFWKGVDTASPVRTSGSGGGNSVPFATGSLAGSSGDLAVAWAGMFGGGTVSTWSNLTTLSNITDSGGEADGAWATGSPTGSSTYGVSTVSGLTGEGMITAIILKPSGAAAGIAAKKLVRSQAIQRATNW